MDVSKIDFSKVEGIIDARYVIPTAKLVESDLAKGKIYAFTDETFSVLMEAYSNYLMKDEK